MNVNNLPPHVKNILQDRELSMEQKMVGLTMFVPEVPFDPKKAAILQENEKVGEEILRLIKQGKISLGKFDKNFKITVL